MASVQCPTLCHKCVTAFFPQSRADPLSLATLRNIYVIPPSQVDHVQEQIGVLEAEIDAADASIVALESALSRAKRVRRNFEEAKERYRALEAPIRRLHADVLAEIFLKTLEHERGRHTSLDFLAILRLGWVCSRWRDVATTTPRLWADIEINGQEAMASHSTRWLNPRLLEHVWLPRSAGTALNVTVLRSLKEPGSSTITQLLFNQAHRWRRAYVPQVYFYQPIHLHLPLLHSLRLLHPPTMLPVVVPCFADAPSLREVICDYDLPDMELPWAELTTISIRMPLQPHAFLQYLRKCTRLGTFSTSLANNSGELQERIHHNVLERWTLSCRASSNGSVEVLSVVTLPALKEFNFTCAGNGSPRHHSFTSFISRSRCTLHRLSLRGTLMAAEDIVEILVSANTVEVLILENAFRDTGTSLMVALTFPSPSCVEKGPPPTQQCVLPRLRRLGIKSKSNSASSPIDEEALVAMIWSRLQDESVHIPGNIRSDGCQYRTKLQELRLGIPQHTHTARGHISRWKEAGLVTHLFAGTWDPYDE